MGSPSPIPSTGPEAIAAAQAWASAQPDARSRDLSLATAIVESGTAASMSRTPDAAGISPADWLAHTIASGVATVTGATANRVSALAPLPGARSPVDLVEVGAAPEGHLATGIAAALEPYAAELDIAVMSVVTRIVYDDRRVSMRLDSGESLNVDRVVVTVPLGVLKTDTLRFSPSLPLLHQRAIARLGVGLVDTVWLRFDSAFWRTDDSGAGTIRRGADRGRRDADGRGVGRCRRPRRRTRARRAHRRDAGCSGSRRSTIPSSRRRCWPISLPSRPPPQPPVERDEPRGQRHEDHEHQRAVERDAEGTADLRLVEEEVRVPARRRRRARACTASQIVGYTSTQPTVDHGTLGLTAMMLSVVQATMASAGTTKCSSVSDHGTSTR